MKGHGISEKYPMSRHLSNEAQIFPEENRRKSPKRGLACEPGKGFFSILEIVIFLAKAIL